MNDGSTGRGPKQLVDRVPLLDVSRDNGPLMQEIVQRIESVCHSGRFVFGPDVQELEQSIAELCRTPHAVGCASGSDALLLSLMAVEVGPGDEVIVPSFTFFATASCVTRLGARPVFVDIDPQTFNIDVEKIAAAVSPRTKAIIPVHLFGQCADMDPICELAREHGLTVIEDAAQSIGAAYHGRPAGSIGDMGCFSFYPTKNLGGFGDGGMLTTRHDELADRLQLLRGHGMRPRYYHSKIGVNSRLDSIQAAVLNVKLTKLEGWSTARDENAKRYDTLIGEAGLDAHLVRPHVADGMLHVWNQYTVRVPGGRRDALREHLQSEGVGSEIYYPVPLHQQECFAGLGYATGSLPETEKAAEEVLSLPIFPGLTEAEQQTVVHHMAAFFAGEQALRKAG